MSSTEPSVAKAVLLGRCPRCGVGHLFEGYLVVGRCCVHCDLDYTVFDPGDGPAVFVILIEGALVLPAVLWLEFTFNPPVWVHIVVWLPVLSVLTILLLRLAKSVLLVLQYKNHSGEGRLSR